MPEWRLHQRKTRRENEMDLLLESEEVIGCEFTNKSPEFECTVHVKRDSKAASVVVSARDFCESNDFPSLALARQHLEYFARFTQLRKRASSPTCQGLHVVRPILERYDNKAFRLIAVLQDMAVEYSIPYAPSFTTTKIMLLERLSDGTYRIGTRNSRYICDLYNDGTRDTCISNMRIVEEFNAECAAAAAASTSITTMQQHQQRQRARSPTKVSRR